MKKLLTSVVLVAGLVSASAVFALEPKIGILDMQEVMQKASQVKQINQQLQDQFKPRQEKLAAAQKNLQNEVEQYNKNAAVLKDADKTKLQNKIVADKQSLDAQAQTFQRDVAAAERDAMKKFMDNLQASVNRVGKEGQYTLVLIRAAVPYIGEGSIDITKQVLDSLK